MAALALAAVGLGGSWLWTTRVAPGPGDELRVTFVDVGQGDAALIELPGGGAWLIDGGGRPFVADGAEPARRRRAEEQPGEAVVALLAARRIRALDLVVLSHPHPDHYLGLRAVARRLPIAELWLTAPAEGRALPPDLAALVADLARAGTRVTAPPLGVARRRGDVALEVLWPRHDGRVAADPIRSVNDDSLVVALARRGRRVLFAGDLEAEGEELLVATGAALAADVVKVPHHGSATSSTPAFVAATRPRAAIVSLGLANRFGFPAAAVVARWQAAGARVLRTDRDGAVTVTIGADGALAVTTFD